VDPAWTAIGPALPDHDLDVIAKGRQKNHQSLDGESFEASGQQRGYLWLTGTDLVGGLSLSESQIGD
jgi:hypothetical protein